MTSETVTHIEYSGKRGERYEVVKPKDSDILKGDGSFVSETDKNLEYTAKKGERYEAVKQGSADIWKVLVLPTYQLMKASFLIMAWYWRCFSQHVYTFTKFASMYVKWCRA